MGLELDRLWGCHDEAGAGQVGAAPGLLLGGDGRPEGISWHLGCRNLRHVALSPRFQKLALLLTVGRLGGWQAGWGLNSDMDSGLQWPLPQAWPAPH